MSRARICLISAIAFASAIFGFAFLVAPQACAGGFELYFWCGVGAACVLLALPFVTRVGNSVLVRIAVALGLATVGAGAWLAGMLAANVRFICGLGYL